VQSSIPFLVEDLMQNAKMDQLRRYRWAFGINSLIWVFQLLIVIFIANSLALLGDAAHSVSDTIVLFGTCLLLGKTIRNPHGNHEGTKRALTRGAVILLWLSAAYLITEGYERITSPVYFPGWPVVLIALVAATGNFFSHRMIHGVDKSLHDHVHRANVLHILADLFISVAVVVSGLGSIFFNFPGLDGWIALIVAGWMFWRGIILFRETLCAHKHDHDDHHH
jgi:cobalt-zinc-cadmium efflux system protein